MQLCTWKPLCDFTCAKLYAHSDVSSAGRNSTEGIPSPDFSGISGIPGISTSSFVTEEENDDDE